MGLRLFFSTFLFLTLLFPTGVIYGQTEQKRWANLKFIFNEVVVLSENLSREIYQKLPVQEKEFELFDGQYYKAGEFVYCERSSRTKYTCSIFLGSNQQGELSSSHEDWDYGHGDLEEVAHDQSQVVQAQVLKGKEGFILVLPEETSRELFLKMVFAFSDSVKGKESNKVVRKGEHLVCVKTSPHKSKKESFGCRLILDLHPLASNH